MLAESKPASIDLVFVEVMGSEVNKYLRLRTSPFLYHNDVTLFVIEAVLDTVNHGAAGKQSPAFNYMLSILSLPLIFKYVSC